MLYNKVRRFSRIKNHMEVLTSFAHGEQAKKETSFAQFRRLMGYCEKTDRFNSKVYIATTHIQVQQSNL